MSQKNHRILGAKHPGPPSGGPGSAGSTSAGSGRAVGHFPPAHAEGVRPRSGNLDENCLGAPWTTKRYSNLQ